MKNFTNLLGVVTLSLAVIATSGCESTGSKKSNLITIPKRLEREAKEAAEQANATLAQEK